jgi:hypothetical protein
MIACVTHGQSSPSRYITPSGCTIRSQPSAGSHDGSSSTSHMAPDTSRRPGKVVRAASQAIGEAERHAHRRRGAAHPQGVDDGHRGGAGERLVQVRQREPLAALAEQPRRDG